MQGAVAAGVSLGLLMASVVAAVGVMMLFPYVKRPSPWFAEAARRFPPSKMVAYGLALAYLAWPVIGVLAGLVYWAFVQEAPGRWLGSPNGAYTAAVVILAVMATLPLALLLRRVLPGVIMLSLVFIGLYGWALPYFAE